jgi:5'-phosphate synthase pdxT subunit
VSHRVRSREAAPRIGVLAVQGDVREHVAALEASGARAARVRRPSELDDVDALVIPGGESTTIDKLIGVFELREPLLKRLGDGMPAYGSCAGMILLADRVLDGAPGQRSLGGIDMTVRRNAFGRQVDSFETDLAVDGVSDVDGVPVRGVFIRAPWVESVGHGVEVLARVPAAGHGHGRATDRGAARIVAVRQGVLLATAFHPELTGDERVHRLFVDMVRGRT